MEKPIYEVRMCIVKSSFTNEASDLIDEFDTPLTKDMNIVCVEANEEVVITWENEDATHFNPGALAGVGLGTYFETLEECVRHAIKMHDIALDETIKHRIYGEKYFNGNTL